MKTVMIEELLSWAFVHELPKGGGVDGLQNANSAWRMLQASSWGKVTAFAELMTLVDTGPGSGNFWIEQGEPHDDALAVGEAVAGLAMLDAVIPVGWWPLADWQLAAETEHGLAQAAVARALERYLMRTPARRAAGLVNLVVGTAILGRAPMWEAPQPKVRMVMRAGRPAWFRTIRVKDDLGREHDREVDGFDPRRQRRHRDAYRKFEFAEDPVGDILSRLDWQLWLAALEHVAGRVRDRLVAHRLVRSELENAPWKPGASDAPIRLVERRAENSRSPR